MRLSQFFEQTPVQHVQNYWNSRPCNIRHSTKPVGSREYFDEVEARKHFVEPHIPGFAEFDRWQGKKVLEIGSGIGTAMINFARSGAQVTAVDLSDKSLELAKQRAQVYGLEDQISFYQANAEELSQYVPIDTYDLVYSFGVIHHTPHPERVIDQIRQYVKPGSTVKIMVYYRYSWKVLWILLTYGKGQFWRLNELVATYSEAQEGCPVTYIYSKPEAKALLNGFEIVDMQVDHIFPYYIPDYKQYKYTKEWYFRWMPQPLFRWLEQHFGWHLCITARVPE
ncbi:class I SAM-dependent methyltransferase [Pantanalinema sp. GBBB05]|uniref:class I SAM-dependent methyltransferase n=1 Tax=Pantanalinema sp. GBBB05 TaxID=2604139 RepID=UPI001DFAB4D6|nr:class I SAM-dependent methyltransferase [Pantanalinema sp. GBBB05]